MRFIYGEEKKKDLIYLRNSWASRKQLLHTSSCITCDMNKDVIVMPAVHVTNWLLQTRGLPIPSDFIGGVTLTSALTIL